jgi:hypothetical protein
LVEQEGSDEEGSDDYMTFNVLITETRSKTVQIVAQTEDEAISQAEKKYLDGVIVLGIEDFDDANYSVGP